MLVACERMNLSLSNTIAAAFENPDASGISSERFPGYLKGRGLRGRSFVENGKTQERQSRQVQNLRSTHKRIGILKYEITRQLPGDGWPRIHTPSPESIPWKVN
mgnify:CR=1 FL=1